MRSDGKEIIYITEVQVSQFAENMFQVRGKNEQRHIVMSESAYNCLTKDQIKKIEFESEILYFDLTTIETVGGGSVRCMMGEVFLSNIYLF